MFFHIGDVFGNEYPSVVYNGYSVADSFHDVDYMAREEHDISLCGVFSHTFLDLKDTVRVETCQRFVENPDLRFVHESRHNRDFLLHSVAVRSHLVVERIGKLEAFDHAFYTRVSVLFGNVVYIRDVIDIFSARKSFVERVVIGNESDLTFCLDGLFFDVVAADDYFSVGNGLNAYDRFDNRAFSRAVRSEEAENFSPVYLKVGVFDGEVIIFAVFFGKVFKFQTDSGIGGFVYALAAADGAATGEVAGFGFLALAVMIFGNWTPGDIAVSALLFGLFKCIAAAYSSIDLNGDGVYWLAEIGIPSHIYRLLPYLITLIVLAFTSKRSRVPKAEGIPYDKGAR